MSHRPSRGSPGPAGPERLGRGGSPPKSQVMCWGGGLESNETWPPSPHLSPLLACGAPQIWSDSSGCIRAKSPTQGPRASGAISTEQVMKTVMQDATTGPGQPLRWDPDVSPEGFKDQDKGSRVCGEG